MRARVLQPNSNLKTVLKIDKGDYYKVEDSTKINGKNMQEETQKWSPTKLFSTLCQTHRFQVKCG